MTAFTGLKVGGIAMIIAAAMIFFVQQTGLASQLSPTAMIALAAVSIGLLTGFATCRLLGQQSERNPHSVAHSVTRNVPAQPVTRQDALRQDALEALGKGVVVTDDRGIIVYVNRAFESITGYAAGEVCGKTPAILQSGKQSPGFYARMWHDLDEKGRWRGTIWNRRKSGELYRERLNIRKFTGSSGETGYVGVFVDISEQDELERALIDAQKHELMSTLAAGVAHNFNNFLAAIDGNAYVGERSSASEKSTFHFQQIRSVTKRASQLVRELMKISHSTSHENTVFELGDIVRDAVQTCQAILPGNISLIARLPEESIGRVSGNASDIEQTLLNFVANARDAMEGQGDAGIVVTLERSQLEARSCTASCPYEHACPVDSAGMAMITVEDNGPGIPAEIQDQVFNPFFTTKEAHKGSGLGLASASQIVARHNGAIWLNSTPNAGSRFSICLPLMDDEA